MRKRFTLIFAAAALVLAGCSLFPEPSGGYFVLTFDGYNNVKHWMNYIDVVEEYGALATFYICRPDYLTEDEVQFLLDAQANGHEVAYHSTRHLNAMELVYFDGLSIEEYIALEITPGLEYIRGLGFEPTAYAHPFGHHSREITEALLEIFTTVRGVSPFGGWSMYDPADNGYFRGVSIDVNPDGSEHIRFSALERAMRSAARSGSALTVYGHGIREEVRRLTTPVDRLRRILETAESLGMNFITASELPGIFP